MMKLLLIIALFAATSFGQSRVVGWPQGVSDQAFVHDGDGRVIPSSDRALEIVEFTVDGRKITPGQRFEAGEDWLKSLSVRVKNISAKKIVSIRLHFGLPETKGNSIQSGFSLEYGQALSTRFKEIDQKAIEPGQEVVLFRDESHYARDRDGIAKRTGLTDFASAIISTTTVKFEDGKYWSTYKLPMNHTNRY